MPSDAELKVIKQKCETDFLFFVRYFFKVLNGHKYQVNSHHKTIADALMRAYRHETRRTLINVPPRYGKTELAVIMFISWSLAKNPKARFIHLSYSDELALDNSARVQELMESDEFQRLWPLQLKNDTRAKSLWRTEEDGGLKAGAAGGTVTGFGAGIGEDEFGGAIIVDDPLKPDDDESEKVRKKVNRRLNTTVKSRCNSPSTPIIMIMQRLHDDDPSGFVLSGGTGEKWEHVKIPVITPEGKPLWTFRQNIEDLIAIQVADKRVWHGQYLQEPIADEGDFFLAARANWYTELPNNLNYYGASDYAASEGKGDYTEHGVFGVLCRYHN